MPGPPRLREATVADVPAIVDLVESAYRGERSRLGWDTEADLIDGRRTDAGMVGAAVRGDGVVLVLEDDVGDLVGCCELTGPDGPGGAVSLGMFAVDPGRQGAGLGRLVLDHARTVARDRMGARRMELSVIDVRHRLVDWYRRRGFEPTGETRPFPYGDERFGRPRRDDLRFAVLATDL